MGNEDGPHALSSVDPVEGVNLFAAGFDMSGNNEQQREGGGEQHQDDGFGHSWYVA